MKQIMLAHGSGGEESNALLKNIFFKHLGNEILNRYEDSAALKLKENIAYTTDSYTVNPLFFNGGDIGKLSICGTCNDLAMMGAKPLYLTCGFMIEEGLLLEDLERIVLSMKEELAKNGAMIVAGDTKVVPKGSVDRLFINTSGIGEIRYPGISSANLCEEDVILCSGFVGEHGAEIFARREGMAISGDLKSDCASLWPLIEYLIKEGIRPKALRDATRGGLAAVLNEWAVSSNVGIHIDEKVIPVRDAIKGICELLGFEAYNLANEGMFVMVIDKAEAEVALERMRAHPLGKDAAIIGKVSDQQQKKVVLNSAWGTKRYLEAPSGELLPRIC